MADRIITVFGATGAQGGGLARAILAHPGSGFAVRAVTRKPDSEAARALAKAGAGVQHVIWSTLEDTRAFFAPDGKRMPVLMGKYNVPHFDAKGEADALFTSRVPTTLLYTSFYWDNLIHFGMGPKTGPDGVLAFTLPMADKRMSGIAAEDIGKCAFGIFREGQAHIGRSVGIAGEHLTGEEMAAALTKALGRPVRYNAVTAEQYRGFGFPGAEDLGNMFQFYAEFEEAFVRARPLDIARRLNPDLQTFAAFLARNKDRIPLA
jgi:uncharacterized protein YbjT (DUF2867 family)